MTTSQPECSWTTHFRWSRNAYFGYVNTLEEFEQLRDAYEEDTASEFVAIRSSAGLGSINLCEGDWFAHKKFFWEEPHHEYNARMGACPIPFDGYPFISLGHREFTCKFGPSRTRNYRPNGTQEDLDVAEDDGTLPGKKNTQAKKTTKMGCSAMIRLREIVKLLDVQAENTRNSRRKANKLVNLKLKEDGGILRVERRFYIQLSKKTDHDVGHLNGELSPYYRCKVCGAVFCQGRKLKTHMIENHNTERHKVQRKGVFKNEITINVEGQKGSNIQEVPDAISFETLGYEIQDSPHSPGNIEATDNFLQILAAEQSTAANFLEFGEEIDLQSECSSPRKPSPRKRKVKCVANSTVLIPLDTPLDPEQPPSKRALIDQTVGADHQYQTFEPVAGDWPENRNVYDPYATDPRLFFLNAPSLSSRQPEASLLRHVRHQARHQQGASITCSIEEQPLAIIREEIAVLPDGTRYTLRSSWVPTPDTLVQVDRVT